MTPLFEELRERFPGKIASVKELILDQVTVQLNDPDVAGIVRHFLTEYQARLVTVFAEDRVSAEGVFYNYYLFDHPGDTAWVILKAPIPGDHPSFPSLAAELPSVNWQEREIQDWFGLEAVGHPNPRRVALHDNWPDMHPLRKDFSLNTVLPQFEGERHVYRPAHGEGVFHIPVGPVHAGIIEPGHFDFAVAGEPILYLQLRMFYTHKGTEKLFENIPIQRAVFLAESISGDSAFSHGSAFCGAVERAAGIEIPARAQWMRVILLELERVANHIADVGAIANDVGFVIANAHAGRMREMVLGLNEMLTGSRVLRGIVAIGGVRRDWRQAQVESIESTLAMVEREFSDLVLLLQASNSTRHRLERTGILRPEKAAKLGIVGVAGRASGVDRDVRRDHPYEAYRHLSFNVPVYQAGDVRHRMKVRIDEVAESIQIIRDAVSRLPEGSYRAPAQPIPPDRCAMSAVEGWRGEIIHWVRTGEGNCLERCKVKDPSINNWPAIVEAVEGNIVADFPVINKSFNLSYSGTDR
ncbi:MAG: NADH-quinone oxidoreductase subunit C [Terracidiphilus sp.]|jgi:Ni,Fe-hydrogenase III large subunit/Ni,Fe-hydrogenase III component G